MIFCKRQLLFLMIHDIIILSISLLYNDPRCVMERYLKKDYIGKGEVSASLRIVSGNCKPHPHDFFELEYILSGEGEYNVDGVGYGVSPGMLFLMTPISFHSVRSDGLELYNVMFSEEPCDSDALAEIALKGSLALEIDEKQRPFFESILSELCRAENGGKYSSHLLNCLLWKISSYANLSVTEPPAASRGMFYIISHFRENPSLAETAAYAGFAPTYFSSLFKKTVGVTYKEYLDRLRFDYAKKLAETTEMTVMEIASESGFDDYPNFIRRFGERFGRSVTDIRREKRSECGS